MTIVQTIDSAHELEQAFKAYNREDSFSPKGLRKLFDYLDNFSDETGKAYVLDVVALCCAYNEYSSIEEFMQEYEPGFDKDEFNEADEDTQLEMIREYLEDNTSVICCKDDCIMFQVF